jgi:hypothetical protein
VKTAICIGFGLGLVLLSGSLKAQDVGKPKFSPSPNTFGTDQVSFYRIGASEFSLIDTSNGEKYNDEAFDGGPYQRYGSGSQGLFVASPHLPSGALVVYLELDYCDEDPVDDVSATVSLCDALGNCSGGGVVSSSGNGTPCGFVSKDVSSLNIQVDNYRNQVTAQVLTGSGTSATRFSGVILGYKLQVSPAPVFPDFNDVPTSHPFFQFVEALYASGITAGCGSGNYCPDAPLTRGQMAVFLSKALGLQWQ